MFPSDEDIRRELLNYLECKKSCRPAEAYIYLDDLFILTDSDRELKTKDGENLFKNKVRWARQNLINGGRVDGSDYGIWKIIESKHIECHNNPDNKNTKSIVLNNEADSVKNNDVKNPLKQTEQMANKILMLTRLMIWGFIVIIIIQIMLFVFLLIK